MAVLMVIKHENYWFHRTIQQEVSKEMTQFYYNRQPYFYLLKIN